ncbi:MAG: GntR family transcriptional regulator [Clostridia bacterium]|nr:GntR family transcriptional regulator [Clostridia bacterium]CDE84538.1 transcriptional regulator GntR family [Clostridium sp. CAG:273]
MNIIISNSSSVPIYEQIKQSIKQAILNNELREEDMLPSVRVMANDLKISFLTVKKAYDELEKEGYIKSVQGKGSFVAPKNSELVQEKKRKEIQNYIEKIIKLAQMSDISEKEIIELFKLMYKGEI